MSAPLVSVVMPAFDEEAFIAEAVDSVLAQAYRPFEVIVVDDGSSDRTPEIASARDVRLVRQAHRGEAAARNAGLAVARGDYWTVFDADDVMPGARIERQVAYLEDHPELGIAFGLAEAFVTPGAARPSHYNPAWDAGPFAGCAGTVMARREILELVGWFDEARALACDLDWVARARDAGVGVGALDHVVLRYRIHSGNVSADSRAVGHAMLDVLRQSLLRRRASGLER